MPKIKAANREGKNKRSYGGFLGNMMIFSHPPRRMDRESDNWRACREEWENLDDTISFVL
jgi:hypothetical protein